MFVSVLTPEKDLVETVVNSRYTAFGLASSRMLGVSRFEFKVWGSGCRMPRQVYPTSGASKAQS